MTPCILAAAAPAPTVLTQMMPMTAQASSAYDVDRLRALVASVQPQGEMTVGINPPVGQTEQSGFRTMGDSILDGVAKFNTGYNDSLSSITNKLEHISSTNPLELGSNFGELMALQVEVARWTMSVMGVDNASKAGTNTVKELSKGG